MNAQAILAAVLTYGPEVLPLIQQIVKWVEEGKTEVSAEDIKLLISYGSKKADDYLAAAGGAPKP